MYPTIRMQQANWSKISILFGVVIFVVIVQVSRWIGHTDLQQTIQAIGDREIRQTAQPIYAVNRVTIKQSQKSEEIIIQGKREQFHKRVNLNYIERTVPINVSRFDYPWRMFHPISNKHSLKESRGRIFYSTLMDFIPSAGLGHSMLITNAEISTALRLNLTYTHRIARQQLPVQVKALSSLSAKDPFSLHIGSVEELFGWGVGEHPRQNVAISICTKPGLTGSPPLPECAVCHESKNNFNKNKIQNQTKYSSFPHMISISNIVEVPERLHAKYPSRETIKDNRELVEFVKANNLNDTAFILPSRLCHRFPSRYITTLSERSFFFHKYWQSHGLNGVRRSNNKEIQTDEDFDDYISRTIKDTEINSVNKRPTLHHLNDRAINIAIHARRGDFIYSRRKMVSVDSYISILEQLFDEVILSSNRSHLVPVSITFYSEGRILSKSKYANHNTAEMSKELLDSDRKVINQTVLKNRIMELLVMKNEEYAKDSSISFQIAENTIRCVHEMVASDIFIGSGSTLSTSVVGSLSRAAFLLIPGMYKDNHGTILDYGGNRLDTALEDNGRITVFDERSGQIRRNEIETIKVLWERFRVRHPALFNI